MPYTKSEVVSFADKLYGLLIGFKDGLGADDMNAMVQTMMATPAIMNEAKEDWDAFVLHVLSVLADRFGDARINTAPPPPTP